MLKIINLGATFLFLSILSSIKIERLLFLKFLKNLASFDSYFWPFNKTHEKIIAIFVISAIMASIWNDFIKFCWHDEKLTIEPLKKIVKIRGIFSWLNRLDKKTGKSKLFRRVLFAFSRIRWTTFLNSFEIYRSG